MNKNYDLKILKKKYGEDFAKLCRNLFPTILEEEGVLSKIIEDNFAPSRFLYKDLIEQDKIQDFKSYVYNKLNKEIIKINNENIETPEVLMDRAGYKLFKCETDEDVKSFRRYYANDEELCTFRDQNRINTNTIFFAVKKNVDEIKRENFTNPKRQDEYGTSVISLQFTKGESSTLSIKNRYNHTVSNPDATFSNDLENIIAGLTESFEKHYGIKLGARSNSFELNNYVQANDGKFYAYNHEVANIYYCPNNVIIDNFEAKQYDKSRYEVFETFVLDKQTKKLFLVDELNHDSFIDAFRKLENERYVSRIEKIEIENVENNERVIKIWNKGEISPAEIKLNQYNQIVEYSNPSLERVGACFLRNNHVLRKLNLPNLENVGSSFLIRNNRLKELALPNLEQVGDSFLYNNGNLTELNLPKLQNVGNCFLFWNNTLQKLYLPSLQQVRVDFLSHNRNLTELNAPNLQQVGHGFLCENRNLTELNLSSLKTVGVEFLWNNKNLKKINLPKLEKCGNSCNEKVLKYLNNKIQNNGDEMSD